MMIPVKPQPTRLFGENDAGAIITAAKQDSRSSHTVDNRSMEAIGKNVIKSKRCLLGVI
jgi:hypothetical protein